jgi:hypothetical protein
MNTVRWRNGSALVSDNKQKTKVAGSIPALASNNKENEHTRNSAIHAHSKASSIRQLDAQHREINPLRQQ